MGSRFARLTQRTPRQSRAGPALVVLLEVAVSVAVAVAVAVTVALALSGRAGCGRRHGRQLEPGAAV